MLPWKWENADFSPRKLPGGVGQLATVCGLFLWGGERIAEPGGVASVSRLWRRCAEPKRSRYKQRKAKSIRVRQGSLDIVFSVW